ncbi:hypothetical protein D3C87_1554360 [compost metagenome]
MGPAAQDEFLDLVAVIAGCAFRRDSRDADRGVVPQNTYAAYIGQIGCLSAARKGVPFLGGDACGQARGDKGDGGDNGWFHFFLPRTERISHPER